MDASDLLTLLTRIGQILAGRFEQQITDEILVADVLGPLMEELPTFASSRCATISGQDRRDSTARRQKAGGNVLAVRSPPPDLRLTVRLFDVPLHSHVDHCRDLCDAVAQHWERFDAGRSGVRFWGLPVTVGLFLIRQSASESQ